MTRPRIAVIGGGITGLAAAYELRNEAAVTVFEASDRLGGKVLTGVLDGIQVEWGPDSLLARDDGPFRLLTEIGLADQIVEPSDFGAWIATETGWTRLPTDFVLGFPASPLAVARSGLLSLRGIARAAADLILPRTKIDGDVSVGSLVRARFGDEVADKIVAPLMSGIRSGDIDEMSLEMAAPPIAQIARRRRSITLGLGRARREASAQRFIGLRSGMSTLVTTLRDASGAEIALNKSVDVLRDDLTIDGRAFDGVVVAVPPYVAGKITGDDALADVSFSPSTVANLVFPPGAVKTPSAGSGLLVPPSRRERIVACTWFTNKWPHVAPSDGRTVVRAVAADHVSADDASDEVSRLLSARAEPTSAEVHHWEQGLPRFTVGHRGRVGAALRHLARGPVRAAGAGYHATGLNDCLAHGRVAAREVFDAVHRRLGA